MRSILVRVSACLVLALLPCVGDITDSWAQSAAQLTAHRINEQGLTDYRQGQKFAAKDDGVAALSSYDSALRLFTQAYGIYPDPAYASNQKIANGAIADEQGHIAWEAGVKFENSVESGAKHSAGEDASFRAACREFEGAANDYKQAAVFTPSFAPYQDRARHAAAEALYCHALETLYAGNAILSYSPGAGKWSVQLSGDTVSIVTTAITYLTQADSLYPSGRYSDAVALWQRALHQDKDLLANANGSLPEFILEQPLSAQEQKNVHALTDVAAILAGVKARYASSPDGTTQSAKFVRDFANSFFGGKNSFPELQGQVKDQVKQLSSSSRWVEDHNSGDAQERLLDAQYWADRGSLILVAWVNPSPTQTNSENIAVVVPQGHDDLVYAPNWGVRVPYVAEAAPTVSDKTSLNSGFPAIATVSSLRIFYCVP